MQTLPSIIQEAAQVSLTVATSYSWCECCTGKKTFLHIVDGSIGTASLDYQPLLRNMSSRSFASPLPQTPPSREEDKRKPRKSSLEDEGSRDFQTVRNFNEDWVIILWKYLIYLIFSRSQTYHTFHSPALTFSLQVFRFRQRDTNSRTFQFGQRISARLSIFSSSCSTHTVKYTCNSQLTMSIIRMLLLFTKLLQLGLKALTPLSLQPVSLEQEEMTTLQTVLLRLIGLHIKVLPQEEFLVKNCFPFGELGLFVKQLLFPA